MEFLVPIVVIPSVLGFILAIGPFRQALAKRLEGGSRHAGPEVEALERAFLEQADRLSVAEHRVEQLEERLDFAERLLSQHSDRARLGEPR